MARPTALRLIAALLLAALSQACTPASYFSRPTVRDLRPAEPSMPGLEDLVEQHRAQGRFLSVQRMEVDRLAALDRAWALVDESVIQAQARARLNANGLRAGVLAADFAAAWQASLPPIRRIAHYGVALPRSDDARHPLVVRPLREPMTLRSPADPAAAHPDEADTPEHPPQANAGPSIPTGDLRLALRWPATRIATSPDATGDAIPPESPRPSASQTASESSAVREAPGRGARVTLAAERLGPPPGAARRLMGLTEREVIPLPELAVNIEVPPGFVLVLGEFDPQPSLDAPESPGSPASPESLEVSDIPADSQASEEPAASNPAAGAFEAPASATADARSSRQPSADGADIDADESGDSGGPAAGGEPTEPAPREARAISVGWRPHPDAPTDLGQLWLRGIVLGREVSSVYLIVPMDLGPGDGTMSVHRPSATR